MNRYSADQFEALASAYLALHPDRDRADELVAVLRDSEMSWDEAITTLIDQLFHGVHHGNW